MIITKQNFARDKNMEYQSVRLQKKILITRKRKKESTVNEESKAKAGSQIPYKWNTKMEQG